MLISHTRRVVTVDLSLTSWVLYDKLSATNTDNINVKLTKLSRLTATKTGDQVRSRCPPEAPSMCWSRPLRPTTL